jgi:hypothetical protein
MVVTVTESSNEKSDPSGSSGDQTIPDDGDMSEKFATDEMVYAYVAHRLREMKDAGATLRELAVDYDVSHPYIHAAINNDAGAIRKILIGFARKHFADERDKLRVAAQRWVDDNPDIALRPPPPGWIGDGLRYPRMKPALLMAFDRGVEEQFLRRFARAHVVGGETLNAEEWWLRLNVALTDEMLARSSKAIAQAKKARRQRVPPKTLDERKKKADE